MADRLHSMAIEDVINEKPDAAQLSSDAGSSLSGLNLGVDGLEESGRGASDSATLDETIAPFRLLVRGALDGKRSYDHLENRDEALKRGSENLTGELSRELVPA